MWKYSRRVKYYETDRMGVVHHSNYLRFIEEARTEWLRDNLMSYSEMEKNGIIIPAVSASERFLSFLRYDDPFSVTVALIKLCGIKMSFKYQIFNDNTGKLCYEGESSHFFAEDTDEYRPYMSFRRKYPDLYKKLLSLVEPEKAKQ